MLSRAGLWAVSKHGGRRPPFDTPRCARHSGLAGANSRKMDFLIAWSHRLNRKATQHEVGLRRLAGESPRGLCARRSRASRRSDSGNATEERDGKAVKRDARTLETWPTSR